MLSKLSKLFHKLAKGWPICVLFITLVVYIAVTLPILQAAPGGNIISLDAQFFYKPDKAFSTIASYGDSAHLWKWLYLTWDILTPILYSLAFSLSISWLFQRGFKRESKFQALNLVPASAGIFDLLENISIVTLLSVYPAQPVGIAWLSTFCTMVKVSLLGVSIVLIVVGFVKAVLNKFKKQQQ